jgi:hypothetical protein
VAAVGGAHAPALQGWLGAACAAGYVTGSLGLGEAPALFLLVLVAVPHGLAFAFGLARPLPVSP